MINIKRIVVFVLVWILLVQNSFFGVVFAAEDTEVKCNTCTMASYEFQTYINFQVEVLQILKKAVRIKEDWWKKGTVWLFSAGILNLPANMIKAWASAFKKGTKELADWAKAAKMWAIMLASMTTELVWKDAWWWLLILFKSKTFVRERTTLLNIDMSIHDTMWDLWMEWLWEDDIAFDLMWDIESLQQKYKENTWNPLGLFTTFNTKWSIKYKDMVHMLLRLNSMLKTFISMNNSAVSSKVITKWWISLWFNQKLMLDMVASYACAKAPSECSSMWKDLANNTKVRSQISKWFETSKTLINKANDDLSEAMLSFKGSVKDTFGDKKVSEKTWLTPKQLAILRTAYGIDTTKLSKEQWIWLEKTIFAISHPWQVVSSINLKPSDAASVEDRLAKEKAKAARDRRKQDEKYIKELLISNTADIEAKIEAEKNLVITRYETGMQAALESTVAAVLMQKQEDKNLFMIYGNLSITSYFIEIWSFMHTILENSIWTKDSKWLVKYLWDTCTAQCANKWTTNCFAK